MGLMALTTHFIGVHTVLGAFVAGVLIGESPILSKHIDEQLRGLILAFFMPVFFGIAGLSADLTVLKDPKLALLALGLIAVASFGKFAGAFIGGEIGGLKRREALALACAMNARGSTEVIVATIGLTMGALSQNLFTMIVAMAVITTMAMPPMLRWGLRACRSARPRRSGSSARSSRPRVSCRTWSGCCSPWTKAPTVSSRPVSLACSPAPAPSHHPSAAGDQRQKQGRCTAEERRREAEGGKGAGGTSRAW
jgi:predicted Kef-type K+ transport protein